MIKKMLNSIFFNVRKFLYIWVITILVNQIFIFGACFHPYCLIAALPHTFFIAALLTYLFSTGEGQRKKNEREYAEAQRAARELKARKFRKELQEFLAEDRASSLQSKIESKPHIVLCPKCKSEMILRKAKFGKHAGQDFWGCSLFPNCKGIVNVQPSEQSKLPSQ